VLQVIPVVPVMQDHSVLLVLLVLVVTMGQLEDPGHRELLDLRDHKDLRVRMVHKDLVEQLVHRVIPEPAGQTETQERRVSRCSGIYRTSRTHRNSWV